jgi:predicted phosphodiesterase
MLQLKFTVATRLLLYFCLAIGASLATLKADEMWVELGPAPTGFTTLARYASLTAKTCPAIRINGRSSKMQLRTHTGKFNALVCESELPTTTRTASIKGHKLPLPAFAKKANPTIVVIGDTGCRIKRGSEDTAGETGPWTIQNCDSPADWPFQEVAHTAAGAKPDLVIHVGDYLYREKACLGVTGCPGGPSGDNLETWEADFFTPARTLLQAAPWVFVRGNHEDCGRAGDGWFTLLDPRSISTCASYTDPYLVRTNLGISLAILDSNPAIEVPCDANNAKCVETFNEQVATYTKAFETISGWNLQHAWLITHRPVWSVKRGKDQGLLVTNAVEEAAWKNHHPAGIDLLLAGHTHVFEAIGFDPQTNRPTQLVIGNSGTKLAPQMTYSATSAPVMEASIARFQKLQDFGFTTLVPSGTGWSINARERSGKVDIMCELEGGQATCQKLQ